MRARHSVARPAHRPTDGACPCRNELLRPSASSSNNAMVSCQVPCSTRSSGAASPRLRPPSPSRRKRAPTGGAIDDWAGAILNALVGGAHPPATPCLVGRRSDENDRGRADDADCCQYLGLGHDRRVFTCPRRRLGRPFPRSRGPRPPCRPMASCHRIRPRSARRCPRTRCHLGPVSRRPATR